MSTTEHPASLLRLWRFEIGLLALIVLAIALILIPAVALVLLTLAHQASVVMTAVFSPRPAHRAGSPGRLGDRTGLDHVVAGTDKAPAEPADCSTTAQQ